jgi:hypothetical protein
VFYSPTYLCIARFKRYNLKTVLAYRKPKIISNQDRPKNTLVENSLDCCCIFPLKKCKVVEIFAGKFKLTCLGDGIIFSSDEVQNSRNWIEDIKDTIELHVECRRTIRKDSSKRKPIRKKDVKNFENDVLSPGDKKGVSLLLSLLRITTTLLSSLELR